MNNNFDDLLDDMDDNTLMASVATGTPGTPNRSIPITTSHDLDWFDIPNTCLKEINGPVLFRDWGLRTATGNVWRNGINIDERIS